jgi:hypothetical protein
MDTTILRAMQDKKLFGPWFSQNWLGTDTWQVWKVFLAALFALPMDEAARAIYKQFTGRDDVPTEQCNEAWLACGRRSGKSRVASLICVFLACFRDYSKVLAPGEVGVCMVIASDKRQARVVLSYIDALFSQIPILSRMVESRTRESITLTNRIRIEVHTASFRSVRGYTVVAAVLDEVAFFSTGDSANPDEEIVNALRPAMATVPGALLLGISSPYARRGVLWQAFSEHYGKAEAPALVWKSATRDMNPTVSNATIALAYARDAAAASAEYGAEFRTDVEGFLSLEVVEAAVRERTELRPIPSVNYRAFVDPSGGQSDSFTLAIAHLEKETAVLDLLHEIQAPFSPEAAVAQFCAVLKSYRISEVTGDRYAGEWSREQFQKRGISYRVSEQTRSELYLELLPLLTSGQCELLRNKKLVAQLVGLERHTARSGRDSVDHCPGGHDDCSNAVAGVLVLVGGGSGVLGLLEYFKSGQAEADLRRLDTPVKPPLPVKTNKPPAVGPCPQCAEQILIVRCGSQWHCNRCAADWPHADAIAPYFGPTRGEWLHGRRS